MGCLECYRKGCDSIMCEVYVPDVGYLCAECRYEFKQILEKQGKEELTKGELRKKLTAFMETEKGDYLEGDEVTVNIDQYFWEHNRNNAEAY